MPGLIALLTGASRYNHREYCETETRLGGSTSRNMSARALVLGSFHRFAHSQRCGWSFGHSRGPVVVPPLEGAS